MFTVGFEPTPRWIFIQLPQYEVYNVSFSLTSLTIVIRKQILYAFILTIRTRYIHQVALDLILIRIERIQRGLIPYPYVTFACICCGLVRISPTQPYMDHIFLPTFQFSLKDLHMLLNIHLFFLHYLNVPIIDNWLDVILWMDLYYV